MQQYCTYNKGITHIHNSMADAVEYKTENNLDTLIWESGIENPNPAHDCGYHKLQPDNVINGATLSKKDWFRLQHDRHLTRYSKHGY